MTGSETSIRQDEGGLRNAAKGPLARLIAAAIATAAGVTMLWQAGLLFQPKAETSEPGLTLVAAETSISAPPVGDLNVGLKEGDVAPDFQFSSFKGERMRLSALRGRPVLLNFWATWCGPCRVELPDMQELERRYQPQGFTVVAMNSGESFKTAERFLQRLGVNLTAFGYDPAQDVTRRYGVQGLPTSYFIDARGVIAKVVTGQLTSTLMESGAQAALANSEKVP